MLRCVCVQEQTVSRFFTVWLQGQTDALVEAVGSIDRTYTDI